MSTLSPELVALQTALAGEYSLQRELGRGGMGIVYLARDVQLDRQVAIKVLPSHLSARHGLRERFLREARTAARLSHPNIVPIHGVGERGGFVYFVMSYVAGETLGERLRTGGPLPSADVMRIMREVAWALEYAHEHGIIHRDIKPDNILLEQGSGRVLVMDFGIARSSDADDVQRSEPGRIAGTAHFMSPEQAAGEELDARSDLYSLGVVGYLALSGRLPFEAASIPQLLLRQATEDATPVSQAAPGVPRELASVIDGCLATRREHRHESGGAVADALQPKSDPQRALPLPLRNWLRARNPAQPVFVGLYTLAGVGVMQFVAMSFFVHRPLVNELSFSALLLAVPVVPILGYHITQARRLFLAGYSLGDLRAALAVDDMERRAALAAEVRTPLSMWQRYLQVVSYGSIGQSLLVTALAASGAGHWPAKMIGLSYVGALAALGLSNAFGVPLLPAALRRGPRSLRDRLWTSRAGAWIAKMIKAPRTSSPIGDAIFRPTEVALGVAAGELFESLPASYRQQLGDLPAIVANLEARAAHARARLEELAHATAAGGTPAQVIADNETQARSALAESVGALERIRLDLLRLHAGESDLAPMTTLLDAARSIGADVERLVAAQREVAAIRRVPWPRGATRTPTPA